MFDLVGFPPSGAQVKAFVAETAENKRAAKVDELLASMAEWNASDLHFTVGAQRPQHSALKHVKQLGLKAKRHIVYVIEKYVDPGYRFSGLWSFARYWLSRDRGKRNS